MSEVQERAYGPSWFAATAVAARPRRRLAGDVDVDVCVVGASIAGLTAARELARRGWSVAVLEARHVGAAASTPHLGLVAPGFAEEIDRIVARVGADHARALWALSAAGAAQVRATIAETGMAGVLGAAGELIVQTVDDADSCRAYASQLAAFGADAEVWPTDRVRAALDSSAYFQAVHVRDAFLIHPLNYALGLAAAAEEAGARIFENARVTAIDGEGVRKRVESESGRVRAAHVVLAAADESGRLNPLLSGTTITLARHLAATAPLDEQLAACVGFSGLVSHRRPSLARYRAEGGRLLWASPLGLAQSPPLGFSRRVARQIAQLYPPLRGVAVTHAWTATATYAVHKMPQIGALAPGLWLAVAFGDHSVNTATMAGDLIARAISEGDDRWRLFSPYELVWAGGLLGKAVTMIALRGLRARTWIGGALARGARASRPPRSEIAAAVQASPPLSPAPAATAGEGAANVNIAAAPHAGRKPRRPAPPTAGKAARRARAPRAKSAAGAPVSKPNGHDKSGEAGDPGAG